MTSSPRHSVEGVRASRIGQARNEWGAALTFMFLRRASVRADAKEMRDVGGLEWLFTQNEALDYVGR